MYFILTAAGRLAQEAAGGTPLSLGSFKLGGLAGYTPTESLTDIQGTVVHTGTPSAPLVQSSNVFKYVITMDGNVGDFQFGEVGLFLPDNTLYAIGVNSTLISKVQANSSNSGSRIIVIECYVMPSGFIYGQLANDARLSLPILGSLDNLPPAASSMSNVYLVSAPILSPSSVLATTDGLNWTVHGYESRLLDLTLVSATSNVLNFDTAQTVQLPQYTGELILICTSGLNIGTVRTINFGSNGSNSYTINSAYLIVPAAGDTFALYQRTVLDTHVYKFLSRLDPAVPVARVNDFKFLGLGDLLRIDGSNFPTANLNFNHVRLTNVGMPVDNRDGINLEYLNTALTDLAQSMEGQIAGGVIQSGYGPPTSGTLHLPPLYADRSTSPNTLYAFIGGGWSKASSESVRFGSGVPSGSTPIVPPVYCNTDNNQAVLFFYVGGNWLPLSLGYGSIINSNLDITGNVTIGTVASNYLTLNGGVVNIPNDLNFISGRSIAINASNKRLWGTTYSITMGVSNTQSTAYEITRNGILAGGTRYDALSSSLVIGAAASNYTSIISNGVTVAKANQTNDLYLGNNADSVSIAGATVLSNTGNTELAIAAPTSPTLGSSIGKVSFGGSTEALKQKAIVEVVAPDLWTLSSTPTRINFSTTQSGSSTPILAFYIDDDRQVYTSTHFNVGGNLSVMGRADIDLVRIHRGPGSDNTFVGLSSGVASGAGFTSSVGLGASTLEAFLTGEGNTAVGAFALKSTQTGGGNTAVGNRAMTLDTLGYNNVAVGTNTLSTGTALGPSNTVVGAYAGESYSGSQSVLIGTNAGRQAGTSNEVVAVGYNAAKALSTGGTPGIVAIGSNALAANTNGTSNTAVGFSALSTNTSSSRNTAVGFSAMAASNGATDTVAVGSNALMSLSFGSYNVAVGSQAGKSLTTGGNSVLIGLNAGMNITTAGYNIALGSSALQTLVSSTHPNLAIGSSSLYNLTSGGGNVALGHNAAMSLTDSTGTTAVGNEALWLVTSGSRNTGIGYQTLQAVSTGSDNTAVGYRAGSLLYSASYGNTALGSNALPGVSLATISDVVAIGKNVLLNAGDGTQRSVSIGSSSLASATYSFSDVSVGYGSLGSAINSELNISIGTNSLHSAQHPLENVSIGTMSLYSLGIGDAVATYTGNTALGTNSGIIISVGNHNTLLGMNAGRTLESGNNNVIIGYDSGNGLGSTFVNSNDNILIGANSGVLSLIYPGSPSSITMSGKVIIGYSNSDTYLMASGTGWSTFSDENLKNSLESLSISIPSSSEVLRKIDPKTFRLNAKTYEGNHKEIGFSAQNILSALGTEVNDKLQVVGTSLARLTLSNSSLVPILVNAQKETLDEMDALRSRIAALEELVFRLMDTPAVQPAVMTSTVQTSPRQEKEDDGHDKKVERKKDR